MNTPEKLNLFDRIFNRHRKEIINRGSEVWETLIHTHLSSAGVREPLKTSRQRDYVEYKVVDRLTGSESIEREYLT
jgi:hypothetical protein